MSDIVKATPADAGCWVDGHWGQYGTARVIELAEGHGYGSDSLPGTGEVTRIAHKHLASIGPSTSPQLTDSEYERMIDADDEVTDWLNRNVAPAGYLFGWEDGEFFLQSDAWWNDVDGQPQD